MTKGSYHYELSVLAFRKLLICLFHMETFKMQNTVFSSVSGTNGACSIGEVYTI